MSNSAVAWLKSCTQPIRLIFDKISIGSYFRLDLALFVLFLAIFLSRLNQQIQWIDNISPQEIYTVKFSSSLEPGNAETNIYTYLPLDSARQIRLDERISNALPWTLKTDISGRKLHWSGDEPINNLSYEVKIATRAVKYNINDALFIPIDYEPSLASYLQATNNIQINHPEIVDLWKKIKPANTMRTKDVLQAIFDYTYQGIESSNYKGTTDALTAYRLGSASCNGKSRLFVALARLNGLPARLVGGLILEEGSKRTTHQWAEVYVENHWVPFGPTNGYFSEVPSHYLRLYQGDEPLIRRTSNINFDFKFSIKKEKVSPTSYTELLERHTNAVNLSEKLKALGFSPTTIHILLLFPLCTLIVTFLRNVIGVKTYGIFMPLLVAAVCLHTGLLVGLIAFVLIIVFAWLIHAFLAKIRLLKTARLAIVITSVTVLFLAITYSLNGHYNTQLGVLSLFPVVIISFVAEKIYQDTSQLKHKDFLINSAGSIVTIICCYVSMISALLHGLFSLYPELYLLILSMLIYIGSWSELKINELFRFKNILDGPTVMGINKRNRDVVYQYNDSAHLDLATDKLKTKSALKKYSIPCPETIATFNNISDISTLQLYIELESSFVVKPNKGSQGHGIIVITEKRDDCWIAADGSSWNLAQLEDHIREIICGSYSQDGEADIAYIEPLLRQNEHLDYIVESGLCDIRIIVAKGKAIAAMLRLPTSLSGGKANLHQGAIGLSINLSTGTAQHGQIAGRDIEHHPDSHYKLSQITLPYWQDCIRIAELSSKAVPLGYLGVDICIDKDHGPLVLEVNGRPGLEIQNVHHQGFEFNLMNALQTP